VCVLSKGLANNHEFYGCTQPFRVMLCEAPPSPPSPPAPPPLSTTLVSFSMFAGDFYASEYGFVLYKADGSIHYTFQSSYGDESSCSCCIYPDYGYNSLSMYNTPSNEPNSEMWSGLLAHASTYGCNVYSASLEYGIYGVKTTDTYGDGYNLPNREAYADFGLWNISTPSSSLQIPMLTDPHIYGGHAGIPMTAFGIPESVIHPGQFGSTEFTESQVWCIEVNEAGVMQVSCPSILSEVRVLNRVSGGYRKKNPKRQEDVLSSQSSLTLMN